MMAADAMSDRPGAYADGMRAELEVLDALRRVAQSQHDAAHSGNHGELATLVSHRRDVEHALDRLEQTLRPLRLTRQQAASAHTPDATAVDALHDRARALVADIIAIDRATLSVLDASRAQRGAQLGELAAGEATLAAYRRAVTPSAASAELIDQVG